MLFFNFFFFPPRDISDDQCSRFLVWAFIPSLSENNGQWTGKLNTTDVFSAFAVLQPDKDSILKSPKSIFMYNRTMCIVKCDTMPNDVISFHTVQCLWHIGVTWDSNKVLFFYISELIIWYYSSRGSLILHAFILSVRTLWRFLTNPWKKEDRNNVTFMPFHRLPLVIQRHSCVWEVYNSSCQLA